MGNTFNFNFKSVPKNNAELYLKMNVFDPFEEDQKDKLDHFFLKEISISS